MSAVVAAFAVAWIAAAFSADINADAWQLPALLARCSKLAARCPFLVDTLELEPHTADRWGVNRCGEFFILPPAYDATY